MGRKVYWAIYIKEGMRVNMSTHIYSKENQIFNNIPGVKKNQRDAQHILSIFRQPPQVSGVSRSIIRRKNRM